MIHPGRPASLTVFLLLGLGAARVGAAPGSSPDPAPGPAAVDEPAVGPWDRSVALERAGRLRAARTVLEQVYGSTPTSYEVAVRLAWLSLRQKRAAEAVRRYRAARGLEGAGPEAAQGLAAALTLHGYQLLAGGHRRKARAAFSEAVALAPPAPEARAGLKLAAPPPTLAPEVWLGGQYASLGSVRTWGLTVSLEVPWWLREDVRLRLAFRHVETRNSGTGMAAEATALTTPVGSGRKAGGFGGGGGGAGQGGLQGRQEEAYVGAAFVRPLVGVELIGLVVAPADTEAALGVALSTRLGFRWGGTFDVAGLHLTDGWHTQLTPTLFWWPVAWLGLSGGARVTLDPLGVDTSARLGVTFRRGRLALFLQGHYGAERWPFETGSFTVTSLAATLEYGGTLTALWQVHPRVHLGFQIQAERLAGDGERGAHLTAALGVRWSSRRPDPDASSGTRQP